MAETCVLDLDELISKKALSEIDSWISKYPAEERQSAVMAALRIVQEEKGYLTAEAMQAVAQYLKMPAIAVYEVASFYTMYERAPVGRHVISVCTNISCKLGKAEEIVKCLEDKLNIKLGETTADGRFTLREVECLAACIGAPMMQIDKNYHENLTKEALDEILKEYA
jgi:NADH-quinone oxidoreductase subunit E